MITHTTQPSYRAFSLTLTKFPLKQVYAVAYVPGAFWAFPAPRLWQAAH